MYLRGRQSTMHCFVIKSRIFIFIRTDRGDPTRRQVSGGSALFLSYDTVVPQVEQSLLSMATISHLVWIASTGRMRRYIRKKLNASVVDRCNEWIRKLRSVFGTIRQSALFSSSERLRNCSYFTLVIQYPNTQTAYSYSFTVTIPYYCNWGTVSQSVTIRKIHFPCCSIWSPPYMVPSFVLVPDWK